jgi:hypothetical protein
MAENLIALLDQIAEALSRPGVSIADFMRGEEAKAGNIVILPGSEPWLPGDDWDESIVVSRRGNEIRLVAISAKQPGHGALKRTVDGIKAAGLVPVIVCPLGPMAEIVRRWGWKRRRVGKDFDTREEHWVPS